MNFNKIAEKLDAAAFNATATAQVSQDVPISLDEAYAVQSISMARRYLRGEERLGIKMGFTSVAKMEQMGVNDMIWGRLTDGMHFESGTELQIDRFIHPRAEPEIAFLVKKDANTHISIEEAQEYVESVAVAIEIIDSRYENFKFSLEDVVADNCSSSGFVLGEWKDVSTNIQDIKMQLSFGDTVVREGNSNAILGNPWKSFVAAVRISIEQGEPLQAGDIVLAGAATAAEYISSGNIVTAFAEGLGVADIRVI